MAEIGVLNGDEEKYTLNVGDILVVEGHANPDEIGRAAVWNNEVPGCLHQNHILRIRINTDILTPNYIAGYLNSLRGRTYMLRYGKTSSGLNTINSTVLSDMTIVCPPIELQVKFEEVYEDSKQLIAEHARKKESLDQLFDSFLDNAFTGELTVNFRDTHKELLATAAVERDTRILSGTTIIHSQETTEPTYIQQLRSTLVRSLSIAAKPKDFGQMELLTLIQNCETSYFTADTIQQMQQNLPPNFVKRCLELFEKVGLIDCVSLWVDPTGTVGNSQGYYQDFYRLPQSQSQLVEMVA